MAESIVVTGSNYYCGQDKDKESHYLSCLSFVTLLFSSMRKGEREDIEEESTGHDSPLESEVKCFVNYKQIYSKHRPPPVSGLSLQIS